MKVDSYRSRFRKEYAIVVRAGTDLSKLSDRVQELIALMAPIRLEHRDIDLDKLIVGYEHNSLAKDIEAAGYGFMFFSRERYEEACEMIKENEKLAAENAIE